MTPAYVLYPARPLPRKAVEITEIKDVIPSHKPRDGELIRYAKNWKDAEAFLAANPGFEVSRIPN